MSRLMKELAKQQEKLFNCVHCGFCMPVCPTYKRLGNEADSPRGRLHFMRAMVEDRVPVDSKALHTHLDRCLGCRACESVCPSGVEYSHLLEGAREATAKAASGGILGRALPVVMARDGLRRPVMALTRAFRATGLAAFMAERLRGSSGFGAQAALGFGMVAATSKPAVLGGDSVSVSPASDESGASTQPGADVSGPAMAKSDGRLLGEGRRVGMLTGCVQEGLLARVNQATERVLRANGFTLVEVSDQGCCGAIHAHAGDLEGARALARRNIDAFEAQDLDLIVVNAAGCGAALKEYPHLLDDDPSHGEKAQRLGKKVRDVSEVLGRPGLVQGAPLEVSVTYDAPCHLLHAQKIADEPLTMLDTIPGLDRRPLKDHDECCGGAGIYGITHPELGGAISGDKVNAILETGAHVVATGNPGCMMQIGAGLLEAGSTVEVVHPIELLDESYRRGGLYR